MLHNYGKVYSVPHTNGKIDYQLNFLADRPTKSVVMISMVADDIKVMVHKSPGKIVEAYIESFEALATTGDLIVIAQNIGSLTASYNVSMHNNINKNLANNPHGTIILAIIIILSTVDLCGSLLSRDRYCTIKNGDTGSQPSSEYYFHHTLLPCYWQN